MQSATSLRARASSGLGIDMVSGQRKSEIKCDLYILYHINFSQWVPEAPSRKARNTSLLREFRLSQLTCMGIRG